MRRSIAFDDVEFDTAVGRAERFVRPTSVNYRTVGKRVDIGGSPDGAAAGSPGALEIDVRNVRLTDLPSLVRPPAFTDLDQPNIRLRGYSPLRGALAVLAPGRLRPRMFVGCVDERLIGFAQFQPGGPDGRWTAIAIGSATGVYDEGPLISELLRFGTTAAGLRGVKRLYAKAPSGSGAVESFIDAGFSPYATETVFESHQATPNRAGRSARVQQRADAWAVHQLYNGSAPRQVQYAEAFTSNRWERRSGGGILRRAWILDEGNMLAAYAGAHVRGPTAVIEIMYAAGQASSLTGFVDEVIAGLRELGRVNDLYCALRGYQAEAATVLERRGFHPMLEQDLLVKYTTALVRAPHPESLPFHAEIIERLPKRAPSFPYAAPTDESS